MILDRGGLAGALALKGMLIGLLVVGSLTAVAWAALVRTVPVEIEARWDGAPLTVVPQWVSLASGVSHQLELACR